MMGTWGYWGGWMIIVWVIIAALVVWGIVALARHSGSDSGSTERQSPLDIAKARYARGEITKEEFERLKHDLM